MFETLYPILFLIIFGTILALLLIGFSIFLGKRTKLGKKGEAYECGMKPVGTTKEPVSVKYYMVAILFILFEI